MHLRHGVPSNLAAELSSFVGREQHVRRGVQLAAATRLLTLCGPGGSGKTRLARRIAAGSGEAAPDGIWWVELATADAVVPAVSRAMAVPVPAGDLGPYLAGARALVVLDNCEHLLPEVAATVDGLLRAAPEVRVLATSREPLGVEGERVWRVPPLEVPPAGAAVSTAARYDAVQLFCERAQAAGGYVGRTDPMVAELCRALDGMPLALELAAARTAAMSVTAIRAALHDRFRVLAGGPRSAPARLRSMLASLAWSHDLCSDPERALLRRLAVFDGGFDADAAVAVAGVAPLGPDTVVEVLGGLVAKSLVLRGDARYRLLETVRSYARDRLGDAGETATTAGRHLAWAAGFAEAREPASSRCDIAVLDELEVELPNLRGALAHAGRAPEGHHGLRLVGALAFFWARRGYGIAGTELGETVIAADPAAPGHLRARALWAVAYARFYGGCFDEAAEIVARALAEEHDDDALTARCRVVVGNHTVFTDPAAAREIEHGALALADEADDRWCVQEALKFIVFSHELQHRPAHARPLLERLERLVAAADDAHNRVWATLDVGMIGHMSGELAEARAAYLAAERAAAEIDDPLLVLYACAGRASVALATGALDELPGVAAVMNRPEMRFAELTLAFAASLGEIAAHPDRPGPLITAGTTIAPYVPVEAPRLVLAGARRALADGEIDVAAAAAEWTRAACAAVGSAMTGPSRVVLARIARRRDDPQAQQCAQDGLAEIADAQLWTDLPDALAVLGGLAVDAGHPAEGTRLLAAADALATTIGSNDVLHVDTAADRRRAESALGEAFAGAWEQGVGLDRDTAVTYARRTRGPRRRPRHGWASLSPAELEVVRLAAAGHANPVIAERLFVTRATVKTHLVHVFAKLGVRTRAQLAGEAVRHGLG
ncbi:MAG TPA: LuxR C-terminal-related transcriptional regulator [Actinomycetospora sp.]